MEEILGSFQIGDINETKKYDFFRLNKREKTELLETMKGVICKNRRTGVTHVVAENHADNEDGINIDEPPDSNRNIHNLFIFPSESPQLSDFSKEGENDIGGDELVGCGEDIDVIKETPCRV